MSNHSTTGTEPDGRVTSQSSLHRRKPCKEEDEQFLAPLANAYEAATLRYSSADERLDSFHTPVKFSWSQFWVSFIYENLPPVFLSPIAALLIERSVSRAWHVCQHRGLCALSTRHNSRKFILYNWLIVYPASWLITLGLILHLTGAEVAVQNIDLWQMVLAYLFLFMRRLVISVKYAYFRPEDFEQLSRPAPHWGFDKTSRRLVGVGWSDPLAHPGLIDDELTCAMDENDLSLQGIPFKLNAEVCESLSQQSTSDLFSAKSANTQADEVTSGFVLYQILTSVYRHTMSPIFISIVFSCALSFALLPIAVRVFYGLSPMGATAIEMLIFWASTLGFLSSLGIMNFVFICAFDFERRYRTMQKIGQLISYPGLPVEDLGLTVSASGQRYLYADPTERINIFAWMNCRKTLRSFGEGFYFRIQRYTSLLLAYSFFCVAVLNLIAWAEIRHHISTVYLTSLIVLVIGSISLFSIYKAMRLQSLSAINRASIKKQLFLMEEQIWQTSSQQGDPAELHKELHKLRSAKALLEKADELMSFNELVHQPTTVLGFAANRGIMGSALGLLVTGCLLAGQGFSASDIAYDINGWFNF